MKFKSCERPLVNQFCDELQWNTHDKSDAVIIFGKEGKIAHFHSVWSNGTAGVRSTKPINHHCSKYYWEILVKERVFGTSMMVGLTTGAARLHSDSFINLIGEDNNGWGLSHKGLLWHNGQWKIYTKPFRENRSTVIGCLYDGKNGTLTYYKDGECLGIAFTGLHLVTENLYPTVCSTAAKTEFIIVCVRREFINLQDRCRDVIRNRLRFKVNCDKLKLPKPIIEYLKMENEEFSGKNRALCSISKEKEEEIQRTKIPMPDF